MTETTPPAPAIEATDGQELDVEAETLAEMEKATAGFSAIAAAPADELPRDQPGLAAVISLVRLKARAQAAERRPAEYTGDRVRLMALMGAIGQYAPALDSQGANADKAVAMGLGCIVAHVGELMLANRWSIEPLLAVADQHNDDTVEQLEALRAKKRVVPSVDLRTYFTWFAGLTNAVGDIAIAVNLVTTGQVVPDDANIRGALFSGCYRTVIYASLLAGPRLTGEAPMIVGVGGITARPIWEPRAHRKALAAYANAVDPGWDAAIVDMPAPPVAVSP